MKDKTQKTISKADDAGVSVNTPLPISSFKRHGCVALLDALGTRTGTIDDAVSYLNFLTTAKDLADNYNYADLLEVSQGNHIAERIDIKHFGDTILLTMPIAEEKINWACVGIFLAHCSMLVAGALGDGIFLRGAVSVGDFLDCPDAQLGPAINDVAFWYEKPDFMGVILTPAAKIYVDWLQTAKSFRDSGEGPELFGVLYDSPLNNGKMLNTYVLDWLHYLPVEASELSWKEYVLRSFKNRVIGPDIEPKYRNTLDFVQAVVDETWE